MSASPLYRRTPALWRRVGAEVLLATPERSDVDRLSAPASAAWLLLERPRTRADLARAVAAEFEVGPEEIAPHVDRLVDELEARGWVERSNGGGRD